MRKRQLDTIKCIFFFKNQTKASITKTLISSIDGSGWGWSLYLGPKALGLHTNQDMAVLNLNSATNPKALGTFSGQRAHLVTDRDYLFPYV